MYYYKVESLRAHGKSKDKYKIIDMGLNSRLDTIQAAILLAKIEIFNWELMKRNANAELFIRELKEYFKTPFIPNNTITAWGQFTLQTNKRKKILNWLYKKNIPAVVYYPIPMHLQPAYKKFNDNNINLKNSEELANTVFSIPIHPYLEVNQKEHIINSLKNAIKYI